MDDDERIDDDKQDDTPPHADAAAIKDMALAGDETDNLRGGLIFPPSFDH